MAIGEGIDNVLRDHEGRIASAERGLRDVDTRVEDLHADLRQLRQMLWTILGAAILSPFVASFVVHHP